MSRFFFALAIFAIASAPAFAVTLFTDGFERASLGGNWSTYASPSGGTPMWATINTTPHQSGGWHVQVIAPGTSRTAYIQSNISTSGYGNITLSYWRMLVGLDGPDEYTAEWYNGNTWTVLESTGASSANDAAYQLRNFTLPIGAEQNPSFAIRFSCLAGAVSEICRVDNLTLTGTANATLPPAPTPPSSASFNYTSVKNAGKTTFNLKPHYKAANGTMIPVNNTLVPSQLSGYEYGVTSGLYEAHFKNLPSTTSSILLRRGVDLSYDPEGIYWDSSAGNDIIDANPNGAGDPDPINKNVFVYPDAFGAGINLTYTYHADELKERIIVANRAAIGSPSAPVAAGQNLSFRADFALHNTNNLDFYVDGVLWSANGIRTNVTKAEFRNSTSTIFTLDTPVAYDSNGSIVQGYYNFRRTLGDLWVEQHFPYSWVNDPARVYPITFDPSTVVEGLNGTVVLNLSDPEYTPLVQVTLYNVSDGGAVVIDPLAANPQGIQDYAIDPSGLEFDYGEVFASQAQGDILYKCPTWNITSDTCEEDAEGNTWIRAMDLTPGANYTFVINNTDPGYYEYSSADGEVSTTSTTFTTVVNQTINVTRNGTYIIIATWQQRGDDLTGNFLARTQFNGTITSELLQESKDVLAANEYKSYGTQYLANLTTGTYWYSLEHARDAAATTSFVKNARVSFFDVAAFPIQQIANASNESAVTLSATLTNVTRNTFTPSMNATYGYIISTETSQLSTAVRTIVQAGDGDNRIMNISATPKDNTEWLPILGFWGENKTTTSDTVWLAASRASGAATTQARRTRISAFNIVNDFDPHFSSSQGVFSTTSTANVDAFSYTFVPQYQNVEYLILVRADYSIPSVSRSARIQTLVNGTANCPAITEPTISGDYYPYVCQVRINVSNTSPINVTVQLSTSNAGSAASAQHFSVLAFRATPLPNNLLCYPLPNQNWTINEPVICDNVTRNTGTGFTNIVSGGSLQIKNNAQITTAGYNINRWSSLPWYIELERGSNIYVTH